LLLQTNAGIDNAKASATARTNDEDILLPPLAY